MIKHTFTQAQKHSAFLVSFPLYLSLARRIREGAHNADACHLRESGGSQTRYCLLLTTRTSVCVPLLPNANATITITTTTIIKISSNNSYAIYTPMHLKDI